MNKKNLIIAGAIGAALSIAAAGGAALAHHAFAAEFDGKAPVLLRGKVTRVEWINPHAWVHVNVVDSAGKATEWMVEGGTPNTLLRSGVPILRTLEIVSSASGKVQVEDACAEIAKHVSQGGQVSDIMAVNPFFPPMMKHMVKAGETTGNVDGMMNKIADFYDTEIDATVAALTSLIEPLLIVFLGVVVGGIVMAMFLPIFQLGAVAGGLQ